MPRGDGTGPMGQGPLTGRRAGYCAGRGTPGYTTSPGAGRGFGSGRGFGWVHGFGFGRGFGNRSRWAELRPGWVAPAPTREQETDWLKARARNLQDALQRIDERLEALEKEE